MLDPDFEQLALPMLLEDVRADLYHNPTFALPIVQPCPMVTTIHDVVFHYRPELVQAGRRDYLARWSVLAARAAACVITVSDYSKQAICQAYGTPPAKVLVIPEAVETERFQPRYGGALEVEFRKRYGIDAPFILYVGALEPKKNTDRLLGAFALMRSRTELRYTLVLAGAGGGMPYDVRGAIDDLPMADQVVVTGYLPDHFVPVAYNAADLFVYVSLYEGFGLPPLEAMACGTPTLVSGCTSLPEVVGNAALKVDPLDTEAIAQAMSWALTDEALRRELACGGRQHAQQFSWQRVALDTLAAYETAAG